MRIAIIADIHGNLEACDAVLDHIGHQDVSGIFSLGDNVGYGPDPERVIERLKTRSVRSVLGNHEMALNRESFISWFNPMAQKAVLYTRAHLSETSLKEIRSYPKSLVFRGMRFVHGAPPASPFLYLFQISDDKLVRCLRRLNERICFAGHTHDLHIVTDDGRDLLREPLPLGDTVLSREFRYVINAGSVGQPRDGDKRAKYLIFDTETYTLSVRAVDYDRRTTAAKIRSAGLPDQYADRLL